MPSEETVDHKIVNPEFFNHKIQLMKSFDEPIITQELIHITKHDWKDNSPPESEFSRDVKIES